MRKVAFLLTAGMALGSATAVQAQSVTASITIPTVLRVDVAGVSSFAFPAVSPTDYAADGTGVMPAGAVNNSTLSTQGNIAHDIEIVTAGNVTEMAYTGSVLDASKPVTDLQWSLDGTTWTSLEGTARDVMTGLARGAHQNVAVVQYQMLLNLANDAPGDYEVTFVYSVTPN